MKRTSRSPKRTSRKPIFIHRNPPKSGDEEVLVKWKDEKGGQSWYAPYGKGAIVSLAIQNGMDEETARYMDGRALREILGVEGQHRPVIDEERLLAVVPGNLKHKGEETIEKAYFDVSRRKSDYFVHRAIVEGLLSLEKKGLIKGRQGARGEGWTRVDTAFKAEQEKEKRKEEELQRMWDEEEKREKRVEGFVSKYGVDASGCWEEMEKLLTALKIKF
jgi:hypothetical protein